MLTNMEIYMLAISQICVRLYRTYSVIQLIANSPVTGRMYDSFIRTRQNIEYVKLYLIMDIATQW